MRRLILVALLAQCTAHAASTNQTLSPLGERTEIEVLKQLFPATVIEHEENLSTREYASELYTHKRTEIISLLQEGFNITKSNSTVGQTLSKDIPKAIHLRRQYQLTPSQCECPEPCFPTPRCYATSFIACLCSPICCDIPATFDSALSESTKTCCLYTGLLWLVPVGACACLSISCGPTICEHCVMPRILPEIERPTQQEMNLLGEVGQDSLRE